MSNGRFRLGLGSQIKPHITRRFSMPWHGAAKQMREFVESVRAIWDTWYDGTPLNYQGDFYQHTLMTPEFSPQTGGLERPPILLAAVGPLMTKTAAQVADGIIVHPFCTEHYLKNVILPRVEPELASRGKTPDDFAIQYPMFIVTGDTEEQNRKVESRNEVSDRFLRFHAGLQARTGCTRMGRSPTGASRPHQRQPMGRARRSDKR